MDIRITEAWDGVCTVLIGDQVVVAGLNRSEADSLVDAYSRQTQEPEAS
jgi:hypothetical protein